MAGEAMRALLRSGKNEAMVTLKAPGGKLESVSGLTQHALLVDVAAKVLADNMASFLCQAAGEQADLTDRQRACNRAYAAPMLHCVLLGPGSLLELLAQAMPMLAASTHPQLKDRSQLRPR